MPDEAEAKRAQKWIQAADRSKSGPIRGIDYVVARAACDACIPPGSPYGKFLASVLEDTGEDMVKHLPL
eukprot:12718077-Heterocapsa_arctica.AAC.1